MLKARVHKLMPKEKWTISQCKQLRREMRVLVLFLFYGTSKYSGSKVSQVTLKSEFAFFCEEFKL
jgi:hypothetical protein